MSLEIKQHRCRACLEYSTETISADDQVADGVSYLGMALKLTNQLKLEPLNSCALCANMAKTAYNTKEPCEDEEADYKLEMQEDVIIQEKVEAEKIKDENVKSTCSALSVKEESKNEQTLETSLENQIITVEEASEVYYDKPCDKTVNYRRKLRSHTRVVHNLDGLQCDYCTYVPVSLNDYTKHVDAEHADERTKNCNYCDKIFFDTRALKDHLRDHKNTKKVRSRIASKKCENDENKVDQVVGLLFVCKICGKKFGTPAILRNHNKTVHKSNDKSCYFCAYLPKSPAEFRMHMLNKHKDKRPLACEYCGKTFFVLRNLKHHLSICGHKVYSKSDMTIHTSEKPFSCSKCDRKFCGLEYLKRHMRTHELDDPSENLSEETLDSYVCEKCNKEFAHHSSLRKHSEDMHCIQISCYYCEYTPTSSSDLERHIRKQHSDNKYFACDKCDEAFYSVQNLKTHLLLHSNTKTSLPASNYNCKVCNYISITKTDLTRHMLEHTKEMPFQCRSCDKVFKHNQSLKIHLAQRCTISFSKVHKANPENRKRARIKQSGAQGIYACKFCDKTFSYHSNVRQHTKFVHKTNDILCSFCDYVPTSKDDLRRHSKTEHADKKTVSCDYCDKKFFDRKYLKCHLAVHYTMPKHLCKICGCTFTKPSHLIEHITIHTEEKCFKCSLCDRNFKLQWNLKRHMGTHLRNNLE